jgi:hypothetical protein
MKTAPSVIAGCLAFLPGLAAGIGSVTASADADGPDFYVVHGVASNDVLNVRAEPDPHAHKVGEIPPGAKWPGPRPPSTSVLTAQRRARCAL